MQMPPLPLLILDGLADDRESVGTLRDHGDVEPYGLALVDEQAVVEALRAMLADELVHASRIDEATFEFVSVTDPAADDASLRRCWFEATPAGRQVGREGQAALEAYFDARPPGQ